MRWGPALLAFAAIGCGPAERGPTTIAVEQPVRVMSLNQCTDQLVLQLLPPDRIASVTWLARDPRFSLEAAAANRVPVNHGGLEEVARTRPDLIVTDTFSNPAGRAILRGMGYPMVELADATSIADIRRNVRTLAAALDRREQGERLIAQMDRALAHPAPRTPPVRVAAWDRDGMGTGTITDAVLRAAGAVDVGTRTGDIEALLAVDPAMLVDTGADVHAPSRGDDRAHHPIVQHRWDASRRLRPPRASLFCATPAIGEAAIALRAQVARFAARSPAERGT